MARVIKAIKDIHVGDKDWTAKVILIEKGMPRDAKSSPTKFQMFVFADAEVIYIFFFTLFLLDYGFSLIKLIVCQLFLEFSNIL